MNIAHWFWLSLGFIFFGTAISFPAWFGSAAPVMTVVGDSNFEGDMNVLDLNVLRAIAAYVYFGDGSHLTGITATGGDTNFMTFSDFNKWYWSKYDLNGSFYGKLDINAGWVPYINATKDLNMNYHDFNARAIWAQAYFGDGSHLTGITASSTNDTNFMTFPDFNKWYWSKFSGDLNTIMDIRAKAQDSNFQTFSDFNKWYWSKYDSNGSFYGKIDINAGWVPYIGSVRDVNFNYKDLNVRAIGAMVYFGDGSHLTGLGGLIDTDTNFMTFSDFNNWYVPYFSAPKDLNLNYHDLFSKDIFALHYYDPTGSGAFYFDPDGVGGWNFNNGLYSPTVMSNSFSDATQTVSIDTTADPWLFNGNLQLNGKLISSDLNANFVPYISASKDLNLNWHDINARAISAVTYFGDGSKLTGITASSTTDTNFMTFADFNKWYWSKYDSNGSFYGINDVNRMFVPYVSAVIDVNLGGYGLKAFGDSNFNNLTVSNDLNVLDDINGYRVTAAKFSCSNCKTSGAYSVAIGRTSIASGHSSIAIGANSNAANAEAIALGAYSTASGATSITVGRGAVASGIESVAVSSYGNASGNFSTTIGASIAAGIYSIAIGYATRANGPYSLTFGNDSNSDNFSSLAINYRTKASGIASFSGGYKSKALGGGSFAFGWSDTGNDANIIADGNGCIAIGYSDSGGMVRAGDNNSSSSGDKGAISLGYNVQALGEASVALGRNVINSDANSVAIGYDLNVARNMIVYGDVNIMGQQITIDGNFFMKNGGTYKNCGIVGDTIKCY